MFVIPGASMAAKQEKTIHLVFNSPWPPPPSAYGYTVNWFMDEFEKRSNGRVQFERHWGGALGGPSDSLEILKSGVIDLGAICWLYNPGLTPLGTIDWAVPFTTTDVKISNKVKRQLYEKVPAFKAECDRNNLTPVFWYTHMPYDLFTKFPVHTLADLKNRKVGASGSYLPKYVAAAGATGVSDVSTEVYMMLEKGVIEGQVHGLDAMTDHKIYELLKNINETGLGAVTIGMFAFNSESFERLPKDLQDLALEIGKEANGVHCDLLEKRKTEMLELWKSKGAEVTVMAEDQRKIWVNNMPDVPGDWARQMEAKGLPGWEMMKTYVDLIEENGHQFPKQWDWMK